MFDRVTVLKHAVEQGRAAISRQRAKVAVMVREGEPAYLVEGAKAVLADMEAVHAEDLAELERLRGELEGR